MKETAMVPGSALDYIKKKKLTPAFSYKDVWNEEHAAAFTVAKAMQVDVLSDIKGAVEKAAENGETFNDFRKNLKPLLQQKGWWGKRTMTDPLTGKEVEAQLGSDRRLRTIYHTNLRSAYQKGRYDRTMASDVHPYMMYRIGSSEHHREIHVRWNNLILPKDDPWWNAHFPPNGYGCNCYTIAVTEARKQRYEQNGAPAAAGGTAPVQTKRPVENYSTFYNERKGFIERIPQDITPGFNWNQGQTGRTISVIQECLKKVQHEMPRSVDAVMNTLKSSTVFREQLESFVDAAYVNKAAGRVNNANTTPVGFLDRKLTDFLKSKGINTDNRNIIVLEQNLITSEKYLKRHTETGNAPQKQDWENLLDYLADADVYWDGSKKNSLLYLKKITESRYLKIAVDVSAVERFLKLPKVDTMYYLELAKEDTIGSNEFNRIMKLARIK